MGKKIERKLLSILSIPMIRAVEFGRWVYAVEPIIIDQLRVNDYYVIAGMNAPLTMDNFNKMGIKHKVLSVSWGTDAWSRPTIQLETVLVRGGKSSFQTYVKTAEGWLPDWLWKDIGMGLRYFRLLCVE